ncbi:MAG: glyceraldehyde 3-phosphate dehydrogenase NAD-binding domain-containing protein [Thermomicrobiales bacterium]
MSIRVAIDGLSGASRHILAAVAAGGFSDLFEVAHIHEAAGVSAIVHRLQRDSLYGRFPIDVSGTDDSLTIGDTPVSVSSTSEPGELDWSELGIDLVVLGESTPTTGVRAEKHLERGAKKVVVAGTPGDLGKLVVFGVNESAYNPDAHHIVGTGSARLNAAAILANIVQQNFAIARGSFTVVHPPFPGQVAVDRAEDDPLAARSLFNIVPHLHDSTSIELGLLSPILGSKLIGSVVCVPGVSPVAWLTVAIETERRFERDDVVRVFKEAAGSDQYEGLLGICDDLNLVSHDLIGDARSVVVSLDGLEMVGRAFVSIRGWFDAEWAMACRAADLIAFLGEAGVPGTA